LKRNGFEASGFLRKTEAGEIPVLVKGSRAKLKQLSEGFK